jgi:hypothetical protein
MTFIEALEIVNNDCELPYFEDAKNTLRRISNSEVSASMSGIEYYEPAATWILERVKELRNA